MQNSLIRPVRFPAIDGIRFYAALATFLEHVVGGAVIEYFRVPDGQFNYHNESWWMKFVYYLADGNHGVDVFFVISGFLMARIVLAEGRSFNYTTFIWNRIKRIYPAFLLSLVVAATADCLLFGWPWKSLDFAKNLIFMNAIPGYSVIRYNHVSWSLGFEFAFYLVIPALLLGRYLDRRIAAFALLLGACYFMPGDFIRMKALFVGALIGSFSDEQLKAIAKRIPFVVIFVLYLGCGLLKAVYFKSYIQYYYTFLPIAALLFVKIVWGDTMLTRFFTRPTLRKLGTLSYSIYLYHSVAASLVLVYLTPGPASIGWTIWYIALTSVLTVVAAWVSYRFVEQWYFERGRHHVVATDGLVGQPS